MLHRGMALVVVFVTNRPIMSQDTKAPYGALFCNSSSIRKRPNQEFLPNPNRTSDFFCRTEQNRPKPAGPRTEISVA